ncbi:hypothetical protein [Streptomyces lavendulocolor]
MKTATAVEKTQALAAARRRLATSWIRFHCLRTSSFVAAFDFGLEGVGC